MAQPSSRQHGPVTRLSSSLSLYLSLSRTTAREYQSEQDVCLSAKGIAKECLTESPRNRPGSLASQQVGEQESFTFHDTYTFTRTYPHAQTLKDPHFLTPTQGRGAQGIFPAGESRARRCDCWSSVPPAAADDDPRLARTSGPYLKQA